MHNGTHNAAPPPPPQIRLNLGVKGGRLVLSSVDLQTIPGGWKTVHTMLLAGLEMCVREILKESHGDAPRVQLASHIPRGL